MTTNTAVPRATITTAPIPVLKPDTIYTADNGMLICLKCAGMTAKYTGRTLDGSDVIRLSPTGETALEWHVEFGTPLACDAGCTTYPLPTV